MVRHRTTINSLFASRCIAFVVDFMILASLSGLTTSYAQTQATARKPLPATRTSQSLTLWRDYLKQSRVPRNGCFTVSYPSTRWRQIPCKVGPLRPYTVGGPSGDFEARAPRGALVHLAEGSFPSVLGVTAESDSMKGGPNEYSVQLNTNRFDTPACKNATLPNCQGWQQFIFSSDDGRLSMQYWLVNFGGNCPQGWVSDSARAPNSCFQNSLNQLPLVAFATGPVSGSWSKLSEYFMIASATAERDTLIMVDNERGVAKSISNSDFVLGLASGWTDAEFNIFGLCCGSQANFNPGSTITIAVSVDVGSFMAPTCPNASFTAETNNLTMSNPDILGPPQQWPRMQFTQSTTAPAMPGTCRTIGGNGLGVNVVYRWMRQSNGDHFLTQDPSGELASGLGYLFEGTPFSLFDKGTPGTTAFNRWLCPSGHHFYTADPTGEAAAGVCTPEGVLGYIATTQIAGTVPLFRWYNAGIDDHFYTTDPQGELAPASGYHQELIAGYVKRLP